MIHHAVHVARAGRNDELEARRVVERKQHAHRERSVDVRSELAARLPFGDESTERRPQALQVRPVLLRGAPLEPWQLLDEDSRQRRLFRVREQ